MRFWLNIVPSQKRQNTWLFDNHYKCEAANPKIVGFSFAVTTIMPCGFFLDKILSLILHYHSLPRGLIWIYLMFYSKMSPLDFPFTSFSVVCLDLCTREKTSEYLIFSQTFPPCVYLVKIWERNFYGNAVDIKIKAWFVHTHSLQKHSYFCTLQCMNRLNVYSVFVILMNVCSIVVWKEKKLLSVTMSTIFMHSFLSSLVLFVFIIFSMSQFFFISKCFYRFKRLFYFLVHHFIFSIKMILTRIANILLLLQIFFHTNQLSYNLFTPSYRSFSKLKIF